MMLESTPIFVTSLLVRAAWHEPRARLTECTRLEWIRDRRFVMSTRRKGGFWQSEARLSTYKQHNDQTLSLVWLLSDQSPLRMKMKMINARVVHCRKPSWPNQFTPESHRWRLSPLCRWTMAVTTPLWRRSNCQLTTQCPVRVA